MIKAYGLCVQTTDERAELVDATESRDIERLEKAIRDFEHAHLPDKGDLSRARRILLSLHEQGETEATCSIV